MGGLKPLPPVTYDRNERSTTTNWRVIRGTENPVEVIDKETKHIVLRVYDWSLPDPNWNSKYLSEIEKKSLRKHRKIQALKKAGMIILAIKFMEENTK